MRLLVVEDEQRLAMALRRGLQAEGFAVDLAADGPTGLDLARHGSYDAVILDVMLPGLSGYRVVRALRADGNWVPVLMLSAKDGEHDQADGLDVGADDYLTKPFSYVVLLARLRALLRRGAPQRPAVLAAGDLSLDPARRRVTCAGVEVDLTGREFSLLEYLLRRQGQVVSKIELLDHVWDAAVDTAPNAVEVYVGYLRRKIGRHRLQTVRGAGYRLIAVTVPIPEQGAPDQAGAGIGEPSSAAASAEGAPDQAGAGIGEPSSAEPSSAAASSAASAAAASSVPAGGP